MTEIGQNEDPLNIYLNTEEKVKKLGEEIKYTVFRVLK